MKYKFLNYSNSISCWRFHDQLLFVLLNQIVD